MANILKNPADEGKIMTILESQLEKLKKGKRIGLMTHVVTGYPSIKGTISLVMTMEKAGADIIELQIPFSDPVVDGPTIMKANKVSLDQKTKIKDCLEVMRVLTRTVRTPLLFMGYYNNVFNYGVKKFCREAKRAGAAGLIIPDIPIEEETHEGFIAACQKYNLHHIRVISPASTKDRLQKNAKVANGFVYCVSRYGTTGARRELDPRLKSYLRKVKQYIKLPLAVGFGISKRKHVLAIKEYAEIAVIGSTIIDIIEKEKSKTNFQKVKQFIKMLKNK